MNLINLYKHHLIQIAQCASNACIKDCIKVVNEFVHTPEGIKGFHYFELDYRLKHLKKKPLKNIWVEASKIQDELNPIVSQWEF